MITLNFHILCKSVTATVDAGAMEQSAPLFRFKLTPVFRAT